ncbi:hypothetical protein HPB48_006465 [Haemaphysalis longicornis]|uniref:C2H2-type domain-containing protein n=1 Tax=Haemaphysalis longicornis TaxID=44386 RepID=A0A9J6FKM4_HAELO|nr:hypothetical protein HPB48_006465 [Haemaphysalis longicornis]
MYDFTTRNQSCNHCATRTTPDSVPGRNRPSSHDKKVQLNMHETLHSGKMSYQCSICGKSFIFRYQLVKHERRHSGERPYTCGTCQKSFMEKKNLVCHERVHSAQRPMGVADV